MFRGALTRLIGLTALVPFLMLAISGFGYSRVHCLFTGHLGDDTAACCPAESAPETSVLRAASCCAREGAAITHPPAEAASPLRLLATETSAIAVAPPAPRVWLHRDPTAVPNDLPPGPSILLKQSFLI
jgi:hypothetical protein